MPKPRKAQVSLETTPYYHCVSRCVRHAFLCGIDSHAGKSCKHRRQWIVDRMKQLAGFFAIDVCCLALQALLLAPTTQCDVKLQLAKFFIGP
ncbi:MAG: transposase [Candidatus Thiodiazotropha sp.]